MPSASQQLRMLNARGLIQARRHGGRVLYRVEANRTIPGCADLVKALRQLFRDDPGASNLIYRTATGYTHPRRVAIVQCLAAGVGDTRSLLMKAALSRQALGRHLAKLNARGIIALDGDLVALRPCRDPLSKALMTLAAAS